MPMACSDIVDAVAMEAKRLFQDGRWTTKEETLAAFGSLGRRLGFKVAAEGAGWDYGEWLYDMSWSAMQPANDGSGGAFFVRQALALETEQAPDRHLDGDFQKLVQARADVRVWIAQVHPGQTVAEHVAVCKWQISKFCGTQPDDTYVFMIFDSKGKAAVLDCFAATEVT